MPYLTQFPAPPGRGGNPSLLAFKIALNKQYTGDAGAIRADQITIEIELYTTIQLSMLGLTLYDETNTGETGDMRKNYIGFYWIEIGEYPQTQETDVDIIARITGEPDENDYYTSTANNKKYARKGTSPNFTYYLVEPVRWLVIGNGSGLNGKGFPDKNDNSEGFTDLADNQLLLISEKVLFNHIYSYVGGPVYWTQSTLYDYFEGTLKNQIFTNSDLNLLGDFKDTKTTTPEIIYESKLSLLTYYTEREREHRLFYYYPYCSGDGSGILKCSYTSFAGATSNYWLRWDLIGENIWSVDPTNSTFKYYHRTTGLGIRPIIILNV